MKQKLRFSRWKQIEEMTSTTRAGLFIVHFFESELVNESRKPEFLDFLTRVFANPYLVNLSFLGKILSKFYKNGLSFAKNS